MDIYAQLRTLDAVRRYSKDAISWTGPIQRKLSSLDEDYLTS
jgi:hypothetical protein